MKKTYADDYETIVVQDENGNEKKAAVYRGEYFSVDLDEAGILRFRRCSLLFLAAIVVLQIIAGCVGNKGMYQFYIAFPYILAFIPIWIVGVSAFRLPKEKRKFQRDEIGLSINRMKTASVVLLIALVIGLIGEVIFLLLNPTDSKDAVEFLFLGLQGFEALAVLFFIRLQRQVHTQVVSEK